MRSYPKRYVSVHSPQKLIKTGREMKCRKWVLRSHFSGLPKRENLEIVEEELPALKDGEFLLEAQWLSVDPYMRPFAALLPLGSTMLGSQVAKVIESKCSEFAVGELVVAQYGWQTHTISSTEKVGPDRISKIDPKLPFRPSTALGVLGMPGATAYFGLLELCSPKEGETLVVNAAAGAVGSVLGQIAKIKGCRVVGFAGSDAKVDHLKTLGFDAAFNYKTMSSLKETLKEACPNGVDIFFDHVGGEFFNTVLFAMNEFGRVAVCGAISTYNQDQEEQPKGRQVSRVILGKQLLIQGFTVFRWTDQWPRAFKEIAQWIQEGKLKYREHVTDGFDNMFDAFLGLFKGENTGKAVVKV